MAKKLKWNLILMSVLYLALGVFLLLVPGTALNVVCYALGAVVLVCAVIRGDRSIIPDGETTICAGDHAIIVSSAGKLKTIDGIVDK